MFSLFLMTWFYKRLILLDHITSRTCIWPRNKPIFYLSVYYTKAMCLFLNVYKTEKKGFNVEMFNENTSNGTFLFNDNCNPSLWCQESTCCQYKIRYVLAFKFTIFPPKMSPLLASFFMLIFQTNAFSLFESYTNTGTYTSMH